MWHFISDTISTAIGDVFICDSAKQVNHQHNHVSYVLKGSQRRFFVKLSTGKQPQAGKSPLACEAEGLRALASTQTVQCPRVLCHGEFSENQQDYEYLVIQYICFKSPSQQLWQDAGTQLALLHGSPLPECFDGNASQYGWVTNNYLGATEQINSTNANWSDFFLQNRIEYYLRQLKAATKVVNSAVLQLVEQQLAQHQPQPCLLHGDLWHGNIGFSASAPVIFDPAIWIGDPECDLAMAELFGGFAKVFFSAYHQQLPASSELERRRPIYQLPHALNHWLMFGDTYQGMVETLVSRIKENE
ncbi:fructosamine kinase family protein [Alteromonas flava]|uniref:fructosamine kinase family protein n=1 Tax=Alteromonas flava TaxID=2048003 RepID=UPI000C2912E2|nr:fructosamine kinase family protein [Alteromonas flava]